jgi:hypothetical protein
MTTLLDQMVRIADERGMKAPEGLIYGFRAVRADFTSKHGYRWVFPGKWAKAEGPFFKDNTGGCPRSPGDGICVANTWEGMASGSIPALNILLVGYRESDILGAEQNGSKLRVKKAFVRDLIDGQALLLRAEGADLRRADLYGANLGGADLRRADLRRANLGGANLYGANLGGADLYGANLYGADLYGADLRRADLRRADLGGANLGGADLYGANLGGADLYGANLGGADLRRADLYGANLGGAINVPDLSNAIR